MRLPPFALGIHMKCGFSQSTFFYYLYIFIYFIPELNVWPYIPCREGQCGISRCVSLHR